MKLPRRDLVLFELILCFEECSHIPNKLFGGLGRQLVRLFDSTDWVGLFLKNRALWRAGFQLAILQFAWLPLFLHGEQQPGTDLIIALGSLCLVLVGTSLTVQRSILTAQARFGCLPCVAATWNSPEINHA